MACRRATANDLTRQRYTQRVSVRFCRQCAQGYLWWGKGAPRYCSTACRFTANPRYKPEYHQRYNAEHADQRRAYKAARRAKSVEYQRRYRRTDKGKAAQAEQQRRRRARHPEWYAAAAQRQRDRDFERRLPELAVRAAVAELRRRTRVPKTHCKRGHELVSGVPGCRQCGCEASARVRVCGLGHDQTDPAIAYIDVNGKRRCRLCRHEYKRRRRARQWVAA